MAKAVVFCALCLSLVTADDPVALPYLKIVDVNQIIEGGTFHITCDAKRVRMTTDEPGNIRHIARLAIFTKKKSAVFYNTVAQYQVHDVNIPEVTQIPEGRNWQVNFTGVGNGRNNRDTMVLDILVLDAKCDDAQEYGCSVGFLKPVSERRDNIVRMEEVTARASAQSPVVTLDPVYNAPPGWKNQSTYELGTRVTLTCITQGPEGLVILWQRERRPGTGAGITYEDYPNRADIITDQPQRTESLCIKYFYKSTLELVISNTDRNRRYQCSVEEDHVVVKSAFVTVDLVEGSNTPEPDSDIPEQGPKPGTKDDTEFSFVCAANQVPFTAEDNSVTDIYSMKIDVMRFGAKVYTTLAMYTTFGPLKQREFQNIPSGRDWRISFSGAGNGMQNRGFMKIELVIKDVKCSDTGMYRCKLDYFKEPSGHNSLMRETSVTEANLQHCEKPGKSKQLRLQSQPHLLFSVLTILIDQLR